MSPLRESTLSVIGAGVMAEAIIAGVLERKLVPAASIIASHPRADRRHTLGEKYSIQVTGDNAEAARRGDVVVLATAVSGTGPTYVFLVMEALIDSAVHLGFPRHLAHDLVLETIKGSVAFAERTQKHPAQLRDMVTSPGGTSAAAFYELERGRLRTVLADAVWAAYRRTMSLSESLSAGKDPEPMPPRSES